MALDFDKIITPHLDTTLMAIETVDSSAPADHKAVEGKANAASSPFGHLDTTLIAVEMVDLAEPAGLAAAEDTSDVEPMTLDQFDTKLIAIEAVESCGGETPSAPETEPAGKIAVENARSAVALPARDLEITSVSASAQEPQESTEQNAIGLSANEEQACIQLDSQSFLGRGGDGSSPQFHVHARGDKPSPPPANELDATPNEEAAAVAYARAGSGTEMVRRLERMGEVIWTTGKRGDSGVSHPAPANPGTGARNTGTGH